MNRPTVDNAPGLAWRPLKNGRWQARWQCRRDIAEKKFKPTVLWLWQGDELTATNIAFIQDQCQRMQNEMLVWARGGVPDLGIYDGTVRGLIDAYRTDADSPYQKLRYKSRQHYDVLCNRLVRDIGAERVDALNARRFLRLYEQWADGTKFTAAHHYMTMVRIVMNFGSTFLERDECMKMAAILHNMKFQSGKPREERITAEQVAAVRDQAHEMGKPSIALGNAFQFECLLRQKDVIGEWVPISEPGVSDVHAGNSKWIRGIRWEEIDANLTLRHMTSKRQKMLEVPLSKAIMLMEEFDRQFPHFKTRGRAALPATGPVIVNEYSKLPWEDEEWRRQWRKAANAAGVPKGVRNMDSRAGGITEATEAGADLEHVKHAATHGNISMTQRYSRGATEKIAGVMDQRAAHRMNKPRKPNP